MSGPTEIRDWRGRRYAVGPSPRELTGRPRSWFLTRALAAAAGIGVLQFGYGAALPVLVAAHGWSPAAALAPFVLWALLQGGTAPALVRFRARGLMPPGTAIPLGALLCALGVASLGLSTGTVWAVLGYGILGGLGAGLVYHSCCELVAGWYPDRRVVRSGAVGGAFALGAVPLLPAVVLGLSPASLAPACAALALLILGLGLLGGVGQQAPPRRWWPPETDPRGWALRGRVEPAAARDYTPTQAWRTGALPALHVIVALAGASTLFTLAALPLLASGEGRSLTMIAALMVTLAATSGLGRSAAEAAAERYGRRRVLAASTAGAALALAGLALALPAAPAAALLPLAALAGVGTGSCYPLTRSLAEDYFGTADAAGIHSLVYSSKGLGGLLGISGAAAVLTVAAPGAQAPWLLAAAAAAAVSALATTRLRRPLPIRTIPAPRQAWTASHSHAQMSRRPYTVSNPQDASFPRKGSLQR
ncbi:MFS transporter [Nocardiopsis oceani]